MSYGSDDDDGEKEFFSEHNYFGDRIFRFEDDDGQICEARFSHIADEIVLFLGPTESAMRLTRKMAEKLIELLSSFGEYYHF